MRVVLSVLGLGILGVTACASAATPYPRAQFVGSCTAKNGPEMAEYCDCSWHFARQDVAREGIEPGKLGSSFDDVEPRIALACADVTPEAQFEAMSVRACMNSSPRLAQARGACTCAYRELRKQLAKSELVDPKTLTTERYRIAAADSQRICNVDMPPPDDDCAPSK